MIDTVTEWSKGVVWERGEKLIHVDTKARCIYASRGENDSEVWFYGLEQFLLSGGQSFDRCLMKAYRWVTTTDEQTPRAQLIARARMRLVKEDETGIP